MFDTTMCAAPDLPVLSRPCEWGGWWRSILKGAFPECGQAFVDVMRSVLELWIHFEGVLTGLPWLDSTIQCPRGSPDGSDERLHVGLVLEKFHLCVDACMRVYCQKRRAFAATAVPLMMVRFVEVARGEMECLIYWSVQGVRHRAGVRQRRRWQMRVELPGVRHSIFRFHKRNKCGNISRTLCLKKRCSST